MGTASASSVRRDAVSQGITSTYTSSAACLSTIDGGVPGAWGEVHRGATGDPRGSSQNNLWLEFLGDYVYAVATNTYGAAVWNDTRNAADCAAIDAWRAAGQLAHQNGTAVPTKPAPEQECLATFGNSDIFGGLYVDPTP